MRGSKRGLSVAGQVQGRGGGRGRGRGSIPLGVLAVLAALMAFPGGSRAAILAPTPYMGWNTYYGVGGIFDEATIESAANSLISTGLAQAGYRIVWLDFGWASGARNRHGELLVNQKQWPGGMIALTAWLHQRGLLAGIYTDAGSSGCFRQGVGSYGHYQQDADTFAQWGFDAVKVDFCGAGQQGLDPRVQYPQIAAAVAGNSSGRPMILNVCNFWAPGRIDGTNPSVATSAYGNYAWAAPIAQSWRTDTDIGSPGNIAFANVLRNLDDDAAHPEAAGPGHWNDPDYLGPGLGMTDTQAQSQISMWAMLAAPLILGSDPRALSSTSIGMLENPWVIAIDQDPLGAQATLLNQSGSGQVWVKPLASGARAVAMLNRGATAMTITTTAAAVGLPNATAYFVQDLWAGQAATTRGAITVNVPPQATELFQVAVDNSGITPKLRAKHPTKTRPKGKKLARQWRKAPAHRRKPAPYESKTNPGR